MEYQIIAIIFGMGLVYIILLLGILIVDYWIEKRGHKA
jgi:hypothetical protein